MVLLPRLAARTGATVLFAFAERLPRGAGLPHPSPAGAARAGRCRPARGLHGAESGRGGLRGAGVRPVPVAVQALFGRRPGQSLRSRAAAATPERGARVSGSAARSGVPAGAGIRVISLAACWSPRWLAHADAVAPGRGGGLAARRRRGRPCPAVSMRRNSAGRSQRAAAIRRSRVASVGRRPAGHCPAKSAAAHHRAGRRIARRRLAISGVSWLLMAAAVVGRIDAGWAVAGSGGVWPGAQHRPATRPARPPSTTSGTAAPAARSAGRRRQLAGVRHDQAIRVGLREGLHAPVPVQLDDRLGQPAGEVELAVVVAEVADRAMLRLFGGAEQLRGRARS